MDPTLELHSLCEKIKAMIPANRILHDATEQFKSFMQSLKDKGIDEKELECIRRSYNYFNHIARVLNPTDSVPGSTGSAIIMPGSTGSAIIVPGSTGSAIIVPASTGSAIIMPASTGSAIIVPGSTGSAPVIRVPGSVITESTSIPFPDDPKEIVDLFKLNLLVELFKQEQIPIALASIKTISENLFSTANIDLDLSWVNISPKRDTLEQRLHLQAEVAKALHELIKSTPSTITSASLVSAAKNVLDNYKPPTQGGTSAGVAAVKDSVRTSMSVTATQASIRLEEEKAIPRIKPLQEEVIQHVKTLYKEFGLV
jgi:hypothetical protein